MRVRAEDAESLANMLDVSGKDLQTQLTTAIGWISELTGMDGRRVNTAIAARRAAANNRA